MPSLVGGRRVLLTGGAGFIGSHVAEALLEESAQLTIVDDLDDFYRPEKKRANLNDIRRHGNYDFFPADICDAAALRRTFESARPEIVIHLAARAGVRPSIDQPELYERVNVGGTLNLLHLAREFHVGKLVFGSSSSVYGISNHAPFSESDCDLRPISPYAATKLAGEHLCYAYSHLYRLPVVALRFFTVYGPRQRPDLAIHKFACLMEAGQPIPIFGDGCAGRDYTYVKDIVRGVIAAVAHEPRDDRGTPFDVFNLGNSHPVKLRELVSLLEAALGRRASCDFQPEQPGDVPLTWADIAKAERVLGYQPATPIELGIKIFIEWLRTTTR